MWGKIIPTTHIFKTLWFNANSYGEEKLGKMLKCLYSQICIFVHISSGAVLSFCPSPAVYSSVFVLLGQSTQVCWCGSTHLFLKALSGSLLLCHKHLWMASQVWGPGLQWVSLQWCLHTKRKIGFLVLVSAQNCEVYFPTEIFILLIAASTAQNISQKLG